MFYVSFEDENLTKANDKLKTILTILNGFGIYLDVLLPKKTAKKYFPLLR